MNEFNNLKFLPGVIIKNFAHRINVLVPKVFDKLKDKESLKSVKLQKFIDCFTSKSKTKNREENIRDYDKAVQRAATLSEVCRENEISSQADSQNSNNNNDNNNEVPNKLMI